MWWPWRRKEVDAFEDESDGEVLQEIRFLPGLGL